MGRAPPFALPLTLAAQLDFRKVPTFDVVFDFLNAIYRGERLAPECLVMCLAYLERLLGSSDVRMHATNWRRLILSSLILASKVWEDQAVWNVDFLSVFPNVSVKGARAEGGASPWTGLFLHTLQTSTRWSAR